MRPNGINKFGLLAIFLCCLSVTLSSVDVYCTYGNFLSDGDCIPCPDDCQGCTSATNCSKCVINRYGDACQKSCKSVCSDERCHKVYGHCSKCADGEYPNMTTFQCYNCPPACNICSAPTQCITCKNGYVGPFKGRCVLTCLEAYKNWMSPKSNHQDSTCDQIPPDELRFICSEVGHCINVFECRKDTKCPIDDEDLTSKDRNICGISERYRRSKECQRLNDTTCSCQTNYSSLISQQQQAPTCPRESDELFASPKTECSTVSEDQTTVISTTQPPSNTSVLIAVVIVLSLLCVAMLSYIAWMKRNLITNCIRVVCSPRSPENRPADSAVEEGMPMTESTNDRITSPSTNGTN